MVRSPDQRLLRRPSLVLASLALLVITSLEAGCASTSPQPLYLQLGGVDGITRVMDRTLDRVSTDARSSRTFKDVKMSTLKTSVAAYVCKVADGPCVYDGQDMKKSHADLDLKGSEFDVMVTVLREELDAAGVSNAAKNELLRRLAPSRRDMVAR